jgi:DNA transposition AAA+ family ATPase
MRSAIARVKNVQNLVDLFEELRDRAPGIPGMAMIHGDTGAGKTTATNWLAVQKNAVFVRATATWTPHTMLTAIMRELEELPLGSSAAMVERISLRLGETQRPIFVDEADYLLETTKLLDTLRDIHDLSTVPLILIGMADFRKRIITRKQVAGRISQWVEFKPADMEDARTLATALCEVQIEDDLLEKFHRETGGSMRVLTVALARAESYAKQRRFTSLSLANVGKGEFTLGKA